jgi:putative FmdB family regulatory protein
MPIYEYRCEACGHTLDALQKISDEPLADCPSCEQSALKRLISAPSFRLKGSGWYETDFKSDKDKKRNLAESPAGASGDKDAGEKPKSGDEKSAKKGDDKPRPKDETKVDKKPGKDKSKSKGTEAA